ncbi:putative ribonuclease H-like domain-containing protein [Tanacetum coccineum]|uniref:Ribonuclease H-like domain-containing protein n=1 Tax=Tanacetum coccineum TaxID=301880 RepID=A0ABQ4Y9J1_9ASTR
MFDIDYLTDSMNYIPVSLENQTNPHAGTSEVTNSAGTLQTLNANASEEEAEAEELIVVPTVVRQLQNLKTQEKEAYSTGISEDTPKIIAFRRELDELAPKHLSEVPKNKATSIISVNSGSGPVNTQHADQDDSDMLELIIFNKPQKRIFDEASYDDEGMVYDFNNFPAKVAVSPIPTFRIHNIHPQSQILGCGFWLEVCLICWVFGLEIVVGGCGGGFVVVGTYGMGCVMGVCLVLGARWIGGTVGWRLGCVSWWVNVGVFSVSGGAWVECLGGLCVVGVFGEVCDVEFGEWLTNKTLFIKKDKKDIMLVQVYVDDIIFGSTRKSWCYEFEALMKGRFQMSSMGELILFLGLKVKQKTDGLFISQDQYVVEMLKKFDLASVKTAITPMKTKMALTKDEEADRFSHVTPKTSHLNVMKIIFKYLKGKPNLGLWYPLESPFDLEAYSDSDYAGVNLDRKSTTGGCQFLGRRLFSWQCKKQTIVATSTTEAEYVAAASCCGQVLWIQNQMLNYGFNFMNTKIYIDNESTIYIVNNPVYHSKKNHIEIRHHFIRDSYEKKLIRVEKIHTDFNIADLLTKAFDGPRFNFLVVNIGMINP